jgi:putative hydrolase of the HAD superfamily
MSIQAVIFDWGGTLTPWHDVDHDALWLEVCSQHYPAATAAGLAAAARAAEGDLWLLAKREQRSATLAQVFSQAGLTPSAELLASYFAVWDQHTITDPEAAPLLGELRERGIKVGVLSNTMWPRDAHERVFIRDNVLGLIDGAVYSSEIPWVKPHPEAFRAAMTAIGVSDPAGCVFIGDRPFDDVHGAKEAGMRAVLIANSSVPRYDAVTPDATITRLSELLPLLTTW